MPQIKLGDLLVKANVITETQLKSALAEQQKWGGRLGDILVRMNIVTEDLICRALSKQLSIQQVNLDSIQGIPPHVKAKVPADTARELSAVPIQVRDDGKTLVVAMAEPQDIEQVDTLRALTKCRIVPNIAGRTSISKAIARFYEGEADVSDQESSFKVVDAQGRTMVKSIAEIEQQGRKPAPPVMPPPARAPVPSLSEMPAPPAANGANPAELLKSVEDVQRKEVAALKAMVELLIEKGVFTREEYVAKVKR